MYRSVGTRSIPIRMSIVRITAAPCLTGCISLIHVRFGCRRFSTSPISAVTSANAAANSAVNTAFTPITLAEAAAGSSAAGTAISRCSRRFAIRISADETGAERTIQIFFPSRETDEAEKTIVDRKYPITSAAMAVSVSVLSPMASTIPRTLPRPKIRNAAAAAQNTTPRPAFIIYAALEVRRAASRRTSAAPALAVFSSRS